MGGGAFERMMREEYTRMQAFVQCNSISHGTRISLSHPVKIREFLGLPHHAFDGEMRLPTPEIFELVVENKFFKQHGRVYVGGVG